MKSPIIEDEIATEMVPEVMRTMARLSFQTCGTFVYLVVKHSITIIIASNSAA